MAHGGSCCPSSCTIYKYIDHRKGGCVEEQATVQFHQGSLWPLKAQRPHQACRQERPGSHWAPRKPPGNLGDTEGSVLPAEPGSQSGVSSVAPGSELEPLSRGQGELVVPRLCGVSMEVAHPVGGIRGRRGHDELLVTHLFPSPQSLRGAGPTSALYLAIQVHAI